MSSLFPDGRCFINKYQSKFLRLLLRWKEKTLKQNTHLQLKGRKKQKRTKNAEIRLVWCHYGWTPPTWTTQRELSKLPPLLHFFPSPTSFLVSPWSLPPFHPLYLSQDNSFKQITLPLGEDHSPTHKHSKSNKSNRSCLWQLALSLTTLCSSVHLDMIDLNYFYWEKLNFTLSSPNKWSKRIAACQWQLSTHTNPFTRFCGTMLCPSHFFVHTKCV